MPRRKTQTSYIDEMLSGNIPRKEPEAGGKEPDKQPEVQGGEGDFIRINITLRESDLRELDNFVEHLVKAGDIPEKNRSFVIRKALKFFFRNYTL